MVGNFHVLKYFLDHHAPQGWKVQMKNHTPIVYAKIFYGVFEDPFHAAAAAGQTDILRYLLQTVDWWETRKNFDTARQVAILRKVYSLIITVVRASQPATVDMRASLLATLNMQLATLDMPLDLTAQHGTNWAKDHVEGWLHITIQKGEYAYLSRSLL
jgi:hypothetical protein